MGGNNSKRYNNKQFLYYLHPKDNRVSIYEPQTKNFVTYTLKRKNLDFYLYYQESISLPTGAIYLIGGKVLVPNQENSQEKQQDYENTETINPNYCVVPTNEVFKINLNKANENLVIDLYENIKPCKQLDHPRSNHALISCHPWIFVLGGFANNEPTNTCLKFHTKTKVWHDIKSLVFTNTIVDPCAIIYQQKFIYLFDTAVNRNLPNVYKYIIEFDQWAFINAKTMNRNIMVPPSIKSQVYQYTHSDLIIFSGLTSNLKNKGNYYTFNADEDLFDTPKTSELLPLTENNKQGDLNYSNQKRIYFGFNGKSVKVYDRETLEIYEIKAQPIKKDDGFSLNCCSR